MSNYTKIRPVGAEFSIRADGQMDMKMQTRIKTNIIPCIFGHLFRTAQ